MARAAGRAPRRRGRGPTNTGTPVRRRSSSGSSPTRGGAVVRPHLEARRRRAGRSRARRRPACSRARDRCRRRPSPSGVLPAPPATTLPTTMHRHGQPRRRQPAARVELPANAADAAEEPRERQQQGASRPRPDQAAAAQSRAALAAGRRAAPCSRVSAALPADDWVAKVICARPARRAASITVITDWCAAVASAVMITTLSLPAGGRGQRARPAASTLRPSTGLRLTA